MKVEGNVKVITDIEKHGENFQKRTCVVVTDGTYPQTIAVEFTQDKVTLLDGIKVGADVSIAINIRGREWTNPEGVVKYFTTLNGWKIDEVAQEPVLTIPTPAQMDRAGFGGDIDELDDLPF